MEGTFIIFVRI